LYHALCIDHCQSRWICPRWRLSWWRRGRLEYIVSLDKWHDWFNDEFVHIISKIRGSISDLVVLINVYWKLTRYEAFHSEQFRGRKKEIIALKQYIRQSDISLTSTSYFLLQFYWETLPDQQWHLNWQWRTLKLFTVRYYHDVYSLIGRWWSLFLNQSRFSHMCDILAVVSRMSLHNWNQACFNWFEGDCWMWQVSARVSSSLSLNWSSKVAFLSKDHPNMHWIWLLERQPDFVLWAVRVVPFRVSDFGTIWAFDQILFMIQLGNCHGNTARSESYHSFL
jgi:hypothetical protein